MLLNEILMKSFWKAMITSFVSNFFLKRKMEKRLFFENEL